ncbi:YciI family protein [Plantactinospora sp. KBS50]|uniref:YciI family protein n=1 Tax=Plantactinospora sp. KBS50 TaxID=2024580 RepID=UPI000BAAA4BC|nr:YciI family protein [Plantactinospora sp. KBS50]ASW58015.1 hypothetical protein CIK06_25965 [Plantactinospora sp. KBS50]
MKFLLLIYNRPGFLDELSERDHAALFDEIELIMKELADSGELLGGQALAGPERTRTVRQVDGRFDVRDRPFVPNREQLAGYVAVDCASIERATEIAACWPDIRFGGAMEVRPVLGED